MLRGLCSGTQQPGLMILEAQKTLPSLTEWKMKGLFVVVIINGLVGCGTWEICAGKYGQPQLFRPHCTLLLYPTFFNSPSTWCANYTQQLLSRASQQFVSVNVIVSVTRLSIVYHKIVNKLSCTVRTSQQFIISSVANKPCISLPSQYLRYEAYPWCLEMQWNITQFSHGVLVSGLGCDVELSQCNSFVFVCDYTCTCTCIVL
jgi:hypothetical protein